MSAISPPGERQTFSWFVFGLMASVTFVGILSELVPSGILPQMTEGLGVSETQVGFLVGVYALASAIAAIPLVSATLAVNRKMLLMALLIGFAASNIVVAPLLVLCGHRCLPHPRRHLRGRDVADDRGLRHAPGTRTHARQGHHGHHVGQHPGHQHRPARDDDDRHHIRLADRIRGPGADGRSHCRAVVFLSARGGRREAQQEQFASGGAEKAFDTDRPAVDLPVGRGPLRHLHLHHACWWR